MKSTNPVIRMNSVYSSGQYQGKRKNLNWSEASLEEAFKLEESSAALTMKTFILPQSLKSPSRVKNMFRVPMQRAQSANPKKKRKQDEAPSDEMIYGIPRVEGKLMHVQSTLSSKNRSTSPKKDLKAQTDSSKSLKWKQSGFLEGG